MWRLKQRRLALLIAALLVPACAYLRMRPEAPGNAGLTELSGFTRSLATPDWLWAHNDSGDGARLFRVGSGANNLGADGGVLTVPGAENFDWEDIAAFRWQGQAALLVGDIGDNTASRDHVSLYAVADPGASGREARLLWTLRFRYPGGARDAEGLAVDPLSNEILILSKRTRPPRLYRLAMPGSAPAAGSEPLMAQALGPVLGIAAATLADFADDPIYGLLRDWPTALDIAPDGRFAVVLTYKDAWLYRHQPGENWADSFTRKPERIDLPQLPQSEAAAISADGSSLLIGSEQRAGFARVVLPAPP